MMVKWARILTLTTALLTAGLSPTAVLAQEAAPEEPPPEREQNAGRDSEPAPARSGSEDSPYDYKASEEISEDLSVSFPVDI
jgi:hypothetical protein